MQDKGEAQARDRERRLPDRRGPRRSPGALLLASTLTRLWTGAGGRPRRARRRAAGLRRLPARRSAPARSLGGADARADRHPPFRRPPRAGLRHRPRRPRARPATPPPARARPTPASPDGGGARYRLTREARLNGVAERGRPTAATASWSPAPARSALLWRDRARRPPRPRPRPSFATAGVPWLRLDAEGRVLEAQRRRRRRCAGGRADLDRRPRRPAAPPRRRAPARRLAARRCAPWCCPSADGRRDLLLMPLDGAEISGLVPDHFLEELPVALARLETERPAHLRQPRRPPAPRRRAPGPAPTSPS